MKQAVLLSVIVTCVNLCTGLAQVLTNGGFEGAFGSTANGWYSITYGGPVAPDVMYSAETSVVHAGSKSQRIHVYDLGDGATLLNQTLDFPAGRTFRASVWLRSDSPMTVAFYLQERVPYYWVPTIAIVDVDTIWQEVVIEGGFDRSIPSDNTTIPGRFVVEPLSNGVLYVDDASLTDVSDSVWNSPIPLAEPVTDRYFGMHINKWGVHQTWPETGHGLMRLWNTGTTWQIMEPTQGLLNDPQNWIYDASGTSGFAFRMDYYVDLIENFAPNGMDIIYTMGKSPSWIAPASYLPPTSLAAWMEYVSILGNRFAGKIQYWEIWNEVDQLDYDGDLLDLIPLTDSAAVVLKGIDPANKILSPNFTGPQALASFLKAGGGEEVDIISWHHYPGRNPEEMIPEIIGIRNVMERYGVGDKPLWNTEGAVSFMDGLDLSIADQAAAVSRAYIIQWSYGIENFNWYCWDIFGGNTDYVNLSYSLTPSQYDSITEPGIAYQHTAFWLKGATMISREFVNGVWVVELTRPGGYHGWIVWRPEGASSFQIPASWAALHYRNLLGAVLPISGSTITIGPSPLLIENGLFSGFESPEVAEELRIYPQPFSQSTVVEWGGSEPADLSIYALTGERVRVHAQVTGGKLLLERELLEPGMYLLELRKAGGQRITGRLLVSD